MTTTEQIVSLPVLNPATGKRSRTFKFMGRVDRTEPGKVIDYKSLKDPARFISQRKIGFQIELYALAMESAGHPITEVEYRLVRVPTIEFCGKDKDAASYEERCVEWMREKPDALTAHTFPVNPARLQQAREFVWECGQRVILNRRAHRWLPNENGCFIYERPCAYLQICEAVADGADHNGIIERDYDAGLRHTELGIEDGLNVLTYSSLTTLTTCEAKYYWQQERGLRKRKDYNESLWLGSAMHAGLEGYAKEGVSGAWNNIFEWAEANPILGEDQAKYQDQQVSRARAMVRACAERWPIAATPAA